MPGAQIRLFPLLFSALLLAQLPAWPARFTDTASESSEKYVNQLSDKGVIAAAPDGKFNPEKPVTRAQLAVWLVKVLGLDGQPVPPSSSFADVKPSDWFFKAVEIIRQNNYISGYADGFRPNQFIQRAEVITILARTLNMPEPDPSKVSDILSKFKDGSQVPNWAKAGVSEAIISGIVSPQDGDTLNATAIATRGQAAALLGKLDEVNISKAIERAGSAPVPVGAAPVSGAPSPGGAFDAQVAKDGFNPVNSAVDSNGMPTGALLPPAQGQVGSPALLPPALSAAGARAPAPGYDGYSVNSPNFGGLAPNQGYAGYAQPGYAMNAGYQPPPMGYYPPMVTTLQAGTTFRAQLVNTLDSGSSQTGEQVQATVDQPLYANGAIVVPAGSKLIGSVKSVASAKRFHAGQNGRIDIAFTSIETPDGHRFPLVASVDGTKVKLVGGSTAGRVGKGLMVAGIGAGSGAVLGTALGAIVGATTNSSSMGKSVGMGALFGGAIGGGVGVVGAVVRKGAEVKFPAGMSLPIKLDAALQIAAPPPAPYGYGNSYAPIPGQQQPVASAQPYLN